MPTYSYACRDCDNAFDIQQAFSDDSLTVCPQCSGSLRKRYGSVGVVFKGSGFYRNDSRKDSAAASAQKANSSSSGSKDTASSSSSSKDTASTSSDSSSTPKTTSDSSSTGSTAKAATS